MPVRVRLPRHPRAPARERLVQVQLVGLGGDPVAAAHGLELRARHLEVHSVRMNLPVLTHTPQRAARRARLSPAAIPSMWDAQVAAGSLESVSTRPVDAENDLPQPAAAAQPALGAAGAQGPCPL